MREPDLSILFGTYNRRDSLERCVTSILRESPGLDIEIVIVDGGSTDGSWSWLNSWLNSEMPGWMSRLAPSGDVDGRRVSVVFMLERERRGAVAAFNWGWTATLGRHVAIVNDDVELHQQCLTRAVQILDDDPRVGQIALAYRYAHQHEGRPPRVYSVHGKTYANLGVIRRSVGEACERIQGGIWNPRYHTYAGDTELSCWVHKLGWRVQGLHGPCATDYEIKDELRATNNDGRNVRDSKEFGQRWPTPRHIEYGGKDPLVDPDELARFRAEKGREG